MYFFLQYTNSQIAAKQQSLALSREAFEPATIKELARLDTRIQAAEGLLSLHLSASKLFDELERVTLSSVKYNNFNYAVSSPGHVVLTMNGEAGSFNAVALESDAFSKSTLITDPIFSNVNVGRAGTITFDFSGIIDTSHMLYDVSKIVPAATAPLVPNNAATSTP